jgi:hypothetical protein
MGTILDFPLSRLQRPLPAGIKLAAHIVIFPGVRIERHDASRNRFLPLLGDTANAVQRGCRSESIKP